jgi:sulfur carrier protein
MRVTVCWSPQPRVVHERVLELPDGATLRQALTAAGWLAGEQDAPQAGVWGRRVDLSHTLRDADRVEVYRPLTVDPKVARRERFRKQGARGTGLFANRRPGAKPGY